MVERIIALSSLKYPEGFKVVYKPYGVDGAGYYYQKVIAQPSTKEKAAETKAHLSKATDAFKAINDILGEKGAIGYDVDEKKWKEIRPLLRTAFNEVVAAGKSGDRFLPGK